MWKNFLTSTAGKVVGGLLASMSLIMLGFFGTLLLNYWDTNVASPEYVNQRINEQTEEVRVMLSLEDQEIRKELSEAKTQSSENQGKLIGKLDAVRKSFEEANQNRVVFQTQVSSDLNYLKKQGEKFSAVQQETRERLRNLESK